MKKLLKVLLVLIILIAIPIIGGFAYFNHKYIKGAEKAISQSNIKDFKKHQNSIIYDKNGKVITNLTDDSNSKYLIYQNIPKNIQDAFVAVEDRSFWEHRGYDLKGIIRVGIDYIRSKGETKHGASTITQQLIRNTFLTKEVTMNRKLNEIAYAMCLEEKYSKENIMEFYVNNIYFGNQQYGIEAASSFYFNKDAKSLTLAESAYLAAIPNSPSYYDPLMYPNHTKTRQEKILKDMLECEYISKQAYTMAINEKISLNVTKNKQVYDDQSTYAVYCATVQLMKENNFDFKYGFKSLKTYRAYKKKYNKAYQKAKDDLYTGGYRIYTSLDNKAQDKMQKVLDKQLKSFCSTKKGIYKFQGASTVIDNKTGNVIAIVGGRSQKKRTGASLNRAFETKRQPGSTIKPILVYGPAINAGYHGDSRLLNVNVSTYPKYSSSGSPISLNNALVNSTNGAAYWLANQLGIKNCLKYLNKMEFGSIVGEDKTLSSALGGMTIGANTVEMASAYYTIYNDGNFVEPTCITKMIDADGIERYFKPKAKRIYKKSATNKLLNIMKGVLTDGTAKNIDPGKNKLAAGKTGTTNDGKDAWFCGISDDYTVSVWVGYDKPKAMSELYGNTYPAKIWEKFVKK